MRYMYQYFIYMISSYTSNIGQLRAYIRSYTPGYMAILKVIDTLLSMKYKLVRK